MEDSTVGLTHAAREPSERLERKAFPTQRLYRQTLHRWCWIEDATVGSPMQLRDPSEGLGRKAFANTEAVQTDSMQVSA